MFIYCNDESLLFLLQALERAQRRIVFILWSTKEGLAFSLIWSSLRRASQRGVRIIILVNATMIYPFQSEDGITVISCVSPTHSKVYVVDNLIISTDRNIEDIYYRNIYRCHRSFDFVFSSEKIGDALENYVWNRGRVGFDLTDGPYRFMIGFLRPFVDNFLSSQENLRILSGTFIPSLRMAEYLRKGNHQTIVGFTEDLSPDLLSLSERFFLSPQTRYVKKLFHYKAFIGEGIALYGSYNLDFISEVYDQEHLILTEDKKIVEELSELYAYYHAQSIVPLSVPLPFSPLIWIVAEKAVHLYRKLITKFLG